MKYAPPFHRTNGFWPVAIALCVAAALPLLFTETYVRHILILIFVYAILASNWDLSLGYGGIVNFAHIAFFAIGLYTYGIAAKIFGLDPWLALLLAPTLAMAFAALLAIPVLRLEGIYVILVTIAAAQLLFQLVVSQGDYTGGTSGMVLLPRLEIGGYRLSSDGRVGYYYLSLLLVVLSTIFLYKLERSALGRAIKALRDNKYYAISRGVSEGRIRLLTLCASAIFPGLAGAFYGAYLRIASPDVFGLGFLTITLSILLLGGVSTIWGPLIAAVVITAFAEILADYGAWRNIIIALMIIAVVVVYPGGLFAAMQEIWGITTRLRTNAIAAWRRRFEAGSRRQAMGVKDRLLTTIHGPASVCDTGGEGQAIVFVHGNSSCKEVFRRQFDEFAGQYRLVSFDLPGHGVSPNADPEEDYSVEAYAEIIRDLVGRLNLNDPIVFGWSLGGYAALEYAAQGNPIKALAICGTSPVNKFPDDMPRGYIPTPHMELAGKRFHSPHEKRAYATHTIGENTPAEPLARRAVWRTDGLAREQVFAKLKTVDWPRQMRVLREGKIPFAMINGPADPFINHEYCRELSYANIWLGAPQNIGTAGHAPFLEEPEMFNSVFRDFLSWAEKDVEIQKIA
ncbi:alpha/beta fold hydrolase [Hoeflea sp. TYP-13]|uniref:alpha/beta fold hydrolase n=1 Tax=Hoeflea sp. TYP-13 TaxID=3230023 RepID=UPI0034C5D60F